MKLKKYKYKLCILTLLLNGITAQAVVKIENNTDQAAFFLYCGKSFTVPAYTIAALAHKNMTAKTISSEVHEPLIKINHDQEATAVMCDNADAAKCSSVSWKKALFWGFNCCCAGYLLTKIFLKS